VSRTCFDGSTSHVTGIVNITAEDFEAMPSQFDGQWLRAHFPHVAQSMDHFIDKIRQETNGEIVGDLEIVRIPLNLYHARNATNRELSRAGLLGQRDLPLRNLLDRYELFAYNQWLRVYMRSTMIKHNEDLFQCVGDNMALLEKLHIY
jgi:hypothetical protein